MVRRRIPIKTIDKESDRQVCFSKRRKGLFTKAKELARAGNEVAIIVFSRAGNAFTFSHPSIESVAARFLSREITKDDNSHSNARGGLSGPPGEGETSNKEDTLDGGNDTIMQDKGLESDLEEDELESESSSEAEGIPIKTIDKESDRQVCFSKRRKGLFTKAKELARAGNEVAIIVFSRAGNAFTFSHPSIESVAARFLSREITKDDNSYSNARGGLSGPPGEGETSNKEDTLDGGNDTIMQDKGLESDLEEDELESESSSEAEGSDIAGSSQDEHAVMHDGEHAAGGENSNEETLHSGRFWWNKRIDNLELRELAEFESALQELQEKVRDRANQILVEKPVWGHYSLDFSKYEFRFPE
ncbi:putative Agamous-like MADS-box protein AGL61 [Cocos nucifera]|nr:putative Agamous-like MADS-box protein AGL61 [Cocos nucifera]